MQSQSKQDNKSTNGTRPKKKGKKYHGKPRSEKKQHKKDEVAPEEAQPGPREEKRSKSRRFFNKRKKNDKKLPKLVPSCDGKLKRIFQAIGVPEIQPFKPDPFQVQALSVIEKSDCLVTAPTGAGKTWIAVEAIREYFERGGRCWYASPLKALSNAKYKEFSEIFGAGNLGILTGDRKENPDAPIIVGTTEILRNQLYDSMYLGVDLDADFVVLDEAHYLGDEDRGVVWEEIMIYLPDRIPLLLLSATVGNADEIKNWLTSIRKRQCKVVTERDRPVPLYPLFLDQTGKLLPLLANNPAKGTYSVYKKVLEHLNAKESVQMAPPGRPAPFGDILKVLRKFNLLPAIFFLKSRMDCDRAVEVASRFDRNDEERKEKRSKEINDLLEVFPHLVGHRQIGHLENAGIGSHHSGQLPSWKLVIEHLMSKGLLDAVFATSTVAAGVNFPARTIVIQNSDRFNGKEFISLTPTEFHQMTGRAGRRGMDNIGFALSLPGKFMDIPLIARLFTAQPSNVESQIRINFSMVLNLLLSHSPEQIEDLLKKSFATYLINHRGGGKNKRPNEGIEDQYLLQDFLRHLNFLKEKDYVTEAGDLTQDGVWASRLRIDQPILVAEGFRIGIFPVYDPALLAAIFASFVNEREMMDKFNRDELPGHLFSTFMGVQKGLLPLVKHMKKRGFMVNDIYLRPALTVYNWANGETWEKTLKMSEMAEGDLAMLMLRTADNLRHIRTLDDVFPEAAQSAHQAVEMILKEPVITSYDIPIPS